MKLVSPKTLLASLSCIVFLAMKIKFFEGILDLFWIAFFGYMTVKGLVIAFSQKAYDEDVKQAYQMRALCHDLFGKFAFIAGDIPIIIIILTALMAILFPITTIFALMLCAFLLFAAGYSLWFSWYVSKHKQLRVENGEWGTATLSTEEEQAWKRSEFWHTICYGIIVVLALLYAIFKYQTF